MGKPELALWAKEDGTGRAYRHPTRLGEDGGPLTSPSVTTILGLVDKPALIQWAADRTLDWAMDNLSLLYVKDSEAATKWGRYRWADVRDERAEVGTGIHETIEALHTGGWKYPVLDGEQRRIMEQWGRLNERYEITPHRSEFTVWGGLSTAQEDWAGTADGLWDVLDTQTGVLYSDLVIDLKTSKNIWPEHWLQLAALRNADVVMVKNSDGEWEEEEIPLGSGTAIIHLREDKFEVLVETDPDLIDMQYQQFMSYRNVWGWKKQVEDYTKAREKEARMRF